MCVLISRPMNPTVVYDQHLHTCCCVSRRDQLYLSGPRVAFVAVVVHGMYVSFIKITILLTTTVLFHAGVLLIRLDVVA
jgi:hypothetical protein